MTAFYNRHPWNLVIGLGFVAALLFGLAVATSPWVVVGLFALMAASVLRQRFIRWNDLRHKGYFGGRRVRDTWVYEEREVTGVRALVLKMIHTEPGHCELFLPSPSEWRTSVPAWAQDRQEEIVRRIAERLGSRDIHTSDEPRGFSREEMLAQMEREGWTPEHRPDGTTLMTPPARRVLIKRLWRRIWRRD